MAPSASSSAMTGPSSGVGGKFSVTRKSPRQITPLTACSAPSISSATERGRSLHITYSSLDCGSRSVESR